MRNLIGTVNKGVYKYKIFNIAVFDIAFTVISAKLLAILIKRYFIFVFLIVYRYKGIRIIVDRLLFPSYYKKYFYIL